MNSPNFTKLHELLKHSGIAFINQLFSDDEVREYFYGHDLPEEEIVYLENGAVWTDRIQKSDISIREAALDAIKEGDDEKTIEYTILLNRPMRVEEYMVAVRDDGELISIESVITLAETQDNADARYMEILERIIPYLCLPDERKGLKVFCQSIGELLGLDRIVFFDLDESDELLTLHKWHAKSDMKTVSLDEEMIGLSERIKNRKPFIVDFPQREEPTVLSSAFFPIPLFDGRFSYIRFDSYIQRQWAKEDIRFLSTAIHLLRIPEVFLKEESCDRSKRIMPQEIFEHLPAAILLFDPETGDIFFTNSVFRSLHAEETDEVIETVRLQFDDIVKAGEKSEPLYREFYVEGSEKWYGYHCSEIQWYDGRRALLCNGREITAQKKYEEGIYNIAYTDLLTQLPNRYRFETEIQRDVEKYREDDKKGYILMVDLDDFKLINDSYGHEYGDDLLELFAEELLLNNQYDIDLYRFGGDEFVLKIASENFNEIDEIIEKIQKRAREPWIVGGKLFYCTVSIGVVQFPYGNNTGSEIIKNAEVAMYAAKRAGKNNYAVYTEAMDNDSLERIELEGNLRNAINDDFKGFTPYFQPIIDPKTNQITTAETLIRWFDLNEEMIMPDQFIPTAEYLGLIIPIGDYIFESSAKLLKAINDNGKPDFSITVNFSMKQLQQFDAVQKIQKVIEEVGVNPHNIVVEVTEGIAASDDQFLLNVCKELRKMGIRIAMDDFGTGYSSLGKLRNMPIDILKIDRSFAKNIETDDYSKTLVRLITELAHSMEITVCMEGVETREQRDICKRFNVDYIQGYYYFRPMPEDEFLLEIEKMRGMEYE